MWEPDDFRLIVARRHRPVGPSWLDPWRDDADTVGETPLQLKWPLQWVWNQVPPEQWPSFFHQLHAVPTSGKHAIRVVRSGFAC
jgi:hypothetical protein